MPMFNNISRRSFLKNSALLLVSYGLADACRGQRKKYTGTIVNDNSSIGHILRDGFTLVPGLTIEIPVLIIGGGISGLSAANHFQKNNFEDYLLLEMGDKYGGNSVSGKNSTSSFPWAAHYLPIVNNSNKELLAFLHEHNVITGFDMEGLPIYNDYYLCFDPEERLFIKGHWQDGLVPSFGVSDSEKEEISSFFKLVNDYKLSSGRDGKPAFEIPIRNSSEDEKFRKLDRISFADFLRENKFDSPHLLWYLNYCCKDDYGSTLKDTSAYAGLHYFCARQAKASNADSSAVLTWPEGNSFLAEKLYKSCSEKIKTNHLITSVNIRDAKVEVITYNTQSKTCARYLCDQVVMCSPQYVNNRILSKELQSARTNPELFEYSPWLIANITLNGLPEHNGEPLSWDNVIYESPSLGYVNACHQHLDTYKKELVLTYYLPLTEKSPKEMRKQLREKTFDELLKEIIPDLGKAHPEIEKFITNIDIKLWGHGMIKPKPDFIFNNEVKRYSDPVQNKIFFAHTDLSGISIFEEAFYQGSKAAKEILNIKTGTRKT